MKRKRLILLVSVLMIFGLSLPSISLAQAAGTESTLAESTFPTLRTQRQVDSNYLRELLIKGLKVTRKDQIKYIDQVVDLVEKKAIPVSYVYASFRSARKRRPDYPFPYFVLILNNLTKHKKIEKV